MHTRAAPKTKLLDRSMDGRMADDVVVFLRERIELARAHGVADEQLILDPGPDFGKTPAQTVEVLRRLDDVLALGRPVLMALSRKDFVGAITGRPPRERLAGTLAALGWAADAGGHVFRVHDVAEAAEFLAVRDVLAGRRELAADARLSDGLRWERQD
jgi:dihydropteroate synthase